MTIALRAENVTKIYGSGADSVTAVDDVSFDVLEGEFIALVGPSGSGKTSMLAMLAGLLMPTHGKVLIEGHEMSRMGDRQRTKFRRQAIGFTFQSNNLVPYLTAQDNVELMLRLNGKHSKASVQRSVELLDRLGLSNRLDHFPSELSGGQQQRVAIAACADPRAGRGAGRRADREPGLDVGAPGCRNLCQPDPRTEPGRHHGHPRSAHDEVRGQGHPDEGRQDQPDYRRSR